MRDIFAPIKNQGLVDVLEWMLVFNPGFRMSATELLKHSIFDSYRSNIPLNTERVLMSIYDDGLYDYE